MFFNFQIFFAFIFYFSNSGRFWTDRKEIIFVLYFSACTGPFRPEMMPGWCFLIFKIFLHLFLNFLTRVEFEWIGRKFLLFSIFQPCPSRGPDLPSLRQKDSERLPVLVHSLRNWVGRSAGSLELNLCPLGELDSKLFRKWINVFFVVQSWWSDKSNSIFAEREYIYNLSSPLIFPSLYLI